MRFVLLMAAGIILALPVRAAADAGLHYKGYRCTQDCSGHRAGYEWARDKGLSERAQCGGKSRSFIEGCYSWVAEQEEPAAEPEDKPDEEAQP